MLDAMRREIENWSQLQPAPSGTEQRSDVEALLAEDEAKLSIARKGLLDADAEQAAGSDNAA